MIVPCVFGSLFWSVLHLLSFNYDPLIDRENMKEFFLSLGKILPCEKCREHFQQNINVPMNGVSLDKALESRELFTKYMYDFHNFINKQTGKTTWPTFQEVTDIYQPLVSKPSCGINTCHSDSNDIKCQVSFIKESQEKLKMIGSIAVIVTVCVIGYYMYSNMKKKGHK